MVDDTRAALDHVVSLLLARGFDAEGADGGAAALKRVKAERFDLVICDVVMPGVGGLELLRLLKERPADDDFLPVMLTSVKGDVESKVQGLRLGADDYLPKPFDDEELVARAEALLRIKRLQDDVREKKRDLERLSVTDGLTGLYNHRWLQGRLKEEFRRAQRYGDPLALILLDLDHFKQVNDKHGHLVGDQVLRELAEVLQRSVRETDLVARYGGEEFVVLLPRTAVSGALTVAERIRAETGAFAFAGERALRCTTSSGIAAIPSRQVTSAELLLRFADEALYRAKQDGRDRVVIYQSSWFPEAASGS